MRWLLFAFAVGCTPSTGTTPSPPIQAHDQDASAYQACTSLCLRPGDCLVAYNDDGICPQGFRCALTFTCSPSPSPSP